MKNSDSILYRLEHLLLTHTKKKKFKSVGTNLTFQPENSVFRYEKISLGDNVFIGKEAIFSCEAEIGSYVLFGPRVYITSGRHEYSIPGKRIREQGEAGVKKVCIEDDCWIGEGSLITRGVRIGEGTVIGGMSIVSKSMPPYCICVGNPCRPIKLRYSDSELREHMRLLGYPLSEIEEMINRRKREIEEIDFKIIDKSIIPC